MLDSSQEEQPILSEPEEPSMSLNRLSKIDTTTNQYIPHITSTSLHSQESQESKQPLESQSDSEQRSTYNFEDKDNKEQARLPSESKSTSATASTPARSPLIVRLRIPASHRSQFAEVLKNPPYPRLGSKKKFVHFDTAPTSQKSASPSTKRRVSEEQADEGFSSSTSKQARHSTGMSSEQRTPSPSSAYSSGLSLSRSSSSSSLPPTFDKDPEEKMAELKELKKLKNRQEDLVHVKDQIIQATQLLEDKESVVDEVRGERKALQSELSKYIGMVVQIRKDLDLVLTAEKDLSKERDQLSQHLTRLRELDYNNLKEEVDQLRAKCGLKSLPSLEQEQEEIMSKYLEQRRGQWREDGFLQDAGLGGINATSSNTGNHAAGGSSTQQTSTAAASSGSSRSRTGRGTGTSHSRDHGDSTSRSRRENQSSSGGGNSTSSNYSSHRRHGSNRSSRSRSQSPSPRSSSDARSERVKKRLRY